MAKAYSVVSSAMSGWGLLRREPVNVLVWGVLLLVVIYGPLAAMMAPFMIDFVRLAGETGAASLGEEAAAGMASRMFLTNILSLVLQWLAQSVIACAVFRAVLEPEARSKFRLRLGAQEAWVALVVAIVFVGVYVASFVLGLGVAVVAIGFYFVGGEPGAVLGAVLGGLAGLGALAWVCLRLSMAAPMSFAERELRLFESWKLTKGYAPRLLGMGLLTLLTVFLAELAVLALILGPIFLLLTGGDPAALRSVTPDMVRPYIPAFLVIAFPLSALLSSAMLTISVAPWAVAYKAIGGATDTPA
ncbi:MAG: hypothetical protein QM608_03930 [Caulobacter sp.]